MPVSACLCVLPWQLQLLTFPYKAVGILRLSFIFLQPVSMCVCVADLLMNHPLIAVPSSLCGTPHKHTHRHVHKDTHNHTHMCYKTYSMYEHDDIHAQQWCEGDLCLMFPSSFHSAACCPDGRNRWWMCQKEKRKKEG